MPKVKKLVPHVTDVFNGEVMPWDFRKDLKESERQYRMFCAYRDMNLHLSPDERHAYKRTLQNVMEMFGATKNTIYNYARMFKWKERAELYDLYIEKAKRERAEARLLQMHDLHAKIGQQMLAKAIKKMADLAEKDVTVNDMLKLLELGIKTERIARTEAVEQSLRTQKLKAEIKLLETTNPGGMVQIVDDVPLLDHGIDDDIGE